MKPLEYIPKAIINTILLSAWVWDFVDPAVKLLATLAGIVLTAVLIRKAWHDTEYAKAERVGKKLDNELKQQELYKLMEENKRRFK
jgi:hypothetical protein